MNDLKERFNFTSIARVKAFYVVSSSMDKYSGTWKSKVREFMVHNKEDMIDVETFDAELGTWEHLWQQISHQSLPKNVAEVFTHCIQAIFPIMCRVLKLLAVTPVTTCTCERSVSSLPTLKSYLRSTMVQVLFFFYSFIAYGGTMYNWFTFIMVIYVGHGSGGCLSPHLPPPCTPNPSPPPPDFILSLH